MLCSAMQCRLGKLRYNDELGEQGRRRARMGMSYRELKSISIVLLAPRGKKLDETGRSLIRESWMARMPINELSVLENE